MIECVLKELNDLGRARDLLTSTNTISRHCNEVFSVTVFKYAYIFSLVVIGVSRRWTIARSVVRNVCISGDLVPANSGIWMSLIYAQVCEGKLEIRMICSKNKFPPCIQNLRGVVFFEGVLADVRGSG